MAQVTVRQAAELAGISRQAMYRCIASGRVSATIDHDGEKQVDTSELLRVFGRLQTPGQTDDRPPNQVRQATETPGQPGSVNLQMELVELRADLRVRDAQIQAQAAEIAALKERIEELRHDRITLSAWMEQMQRLLPAPNKGRKKAGKA